MNQTWQEVNHSSKILDVWLARQTLDIEAHIADGNVEIPILYTLEITFHTTMNEIFRYNLFDN